MFHHLWLAYSQWSDSKEQCRKMFQYREGGGGGGAKGMFLWFKSVHLRNYLIRLCPKIMEGDSSPQSPPPPPPPLLPTPLLNQSISCFVIGVVFLLFLSLFLLNLASVVREWVKLSRSVEQRF